MILVGWLSLAPFSRSKAYGGILSIQCGGGVLMWYVVVDEGRE